MRARDGKKIKRESLEGVRSLYTVQTREEEAG